MYECERWTTKKAGRPRIDAFELWCWRRLLRVPWTARRSTQSIWKEISPEYSWEGMNDNTEEMNDAEAEVPILWPPDAKSWLIWKDPDAGKDWRQKEKGTTEDEMVGWHHQLSGPAAAAAAKSLQSWVWVDFGSWWWTGRPGMLQSMGLQRVRQDRATELNWTGSTTYQGCDRGQFLSSPCVSVSSPVQWGYDSTIRKATLQLHENGWFWWEGERRNERAMCPVCRSEARAKQELNKYLRN